jgi:hypothetical protein
MASIFAIACNHIMLSSSVLRYHHNIPSWSVLGSQCAPPNESNASHQTHHDIIRSQHECHTSSSQGTRSYNAHGRCPSRLLRTHLFTPQRCIARSDKREVVQRSTVRPSRPCSLPGATMLQQCSDQERQPGAQGLARIAQGSSQRHPQLGPSRERPIQPLQRPAHGSRHQAGVHLAPDFQSPKD